MRAPKSFEDGMSRLETILTQMQSEETTLAESVKLYAEAASLPVRPICPRDRMCAKQPVTA